MGLSCFLLYEKQPLAERVVEGDAVNRKTSHF